MNLYDFDHTIYRGDVSIDFIKYCLVRRPYLWYLLPIFAITIVRYVFGFRTRGQVKEIVFSFLPKIKDIDRDLESFWAIHKTHIRKWYIEQKRETDVIVSASPEFLLRPIADILNIQNLVATKMDKRTGRIIGENCRSKEKVRRLEELGLHRGIQAAYSDSLSDAPMLSLAKRAYIVKGDRIINFADYAPSNLSLLKRLSFIRFLFVGAFNAVLGVLFSYLFYTVTGSPQMAFVIGFLLSLSISYFLNSILVFRDNQYALLKFIKFCLSYLPNFIIQFMFVYLFVDIFNIAPIIAYIAAVTIAVPITFIILSLRVFTKG